MWLEDTGKGAWTSKGVWLAMAGGDEDEEDEEDEEEEEEDGETSGEE
jgi:hypothetical protein